MRRQTSRPASSVVPAARRWSSLRSWTVRNESEHLHDNDHSTTRHTNTLWGVQRDSVRLGQPETARFATKPHRQCEDTASFTTETTSGHSTRVRLTRQSQPTNPNYPHSVSCRPRGFLPRALLAVCAEALSVIHEPPRKRRQLTNLND